MAFSGDNYGDNLFAHFGVGEAKHGNFGYGGMGGKYIFNFAGIDVVATADNQFAGTTSDSVVAIVAAPTEITGFEPAIGAEGFGSSIGSVPVAREDVGAAHF